MMRNATERQHVRRLLDQARKAGVPKYRLEILARVHPRRYRPFAIQDEVAYQSAYRITHAGETLAARKSREARETMQRGVQRVAGRA